MDKNNVKKKNIKAIGIIILFMSFILILVSKTIYMHRLPVVTATLPFNGKLSKTEKSKGFAKWAETKDIYVDIGGKVETVFVKEGQLVEKGDVLFSLSFNEDDIIQSLKELEVTCGQKNAEISNFQLQIEANNRQINELGSEMHKTNDFEFKKLESEIEKAKKDLENLKVLFESGFVSENEYENAYNNLQLMKDEMTDLDKEREEKISGYKDENKILINQILQLEFDLNAYDIQKEAYETKLNKFDEDTTIYALEKGEIIQLLVKEGQQIEDGWHVVEIGCGGTYEITCNLSLENNFVIAGDKCKLKNTNHSFEGVITKITLIESGKIVTVSAQSNKISSGETFDVTFEKDSLETYTLVPNGALNMDNDGYFLYQLKRRDGILGEEYYVQKLRVYIGDNDDQNTVITKGLSFYEPIVLTSNKSFAEGQSLTLSTVGDFFEN